MTSAIDMRILILPASLVLALFLAVGTSAAPMQGVLPGLSQYKTAESVILVQKKWPGTGKKKGKKRKKGKKGKKGQKGSSKKGKCARLAEKHGLPASECRKLKGEKKCLLLARKHGLPKQECKSL
jgi:hypothetical protein